MAPQLGLEDRRGEEYVPKSYYAFGGEGNSLKGVGDEDGGGKVTAATTSEDGIAPAAPIVDDSAPTASIRVRLSTGKSIIAKVRVGEPQLKSHMSVSRVCSNTCLICSF